MKPIFSSLLDLFFPRLCVVCEARLQQSEEHLCLACLGNLPRTNYHIDDDNRLVDFLAGRFPFRKAAAYTYFVKDGSVQAIIHELKYRHNKRIGHFMGGLCAKDLAISKFLSDVDCLVPVPLHPKREKKRGYNQALEICRGLSEKTAIPIAEKVLVRTVNNPSQTHNSRTKRWNNVADIFSITDEAFFVNKHILLVDDVITTGSTIGSCAKELAKIDGCTISVFAFGIAT